MTDKHTTCLDDEAIFLVKALGGRWQGDTALCLCPAHDSAVPELRVTIGAQALGFHCTAGCDERDIVSATANVRDDSAARARAQITDRAGEHAATKSARTAWDCAQPIGGTYAERYLASLGIETYASELRYTPRCAARAGKSTTYHPALLAAVRDEGGLVAVERSYLRSDGLGLADITHPKRMLGFPAGGVGRWGAAPSKILRLAEDVEEAASAIIVGSQGIPIWPVFGAKRYATIDVPPRIEHIIIYARVDDQSTTAISDAQSHLSANGRTVAVVHPPRAASWNAYLRLIKS
jgi:putative DNA primase/helicase